MFLCIRARFLSKRSDDICATSFPNVAFGRTIDRHGAKGDTRIVNARAANRRVVVDE